ncbi:hypothetical protein MLD38_000513 [Melastoma candidum]|uniref:Uncharacterized protein n=1 Tax=Melastoma candidum TaxID=119954 RepID=A0ACB9SBK7_9MYRT|nr:hypothetical protein MLD38_000513 [Melastoma candidum]
MARGFFSCMGRGSSQERAAAMADAAAEENQRGDAVLVELFSSQGCATSPEAEILVSRLGRGDFELGFPVIVLVYHVDYWDYTGWKDPFGSSSSTVRQKAYVEALRLDTLLTPQVIIQGRAHCVGTDQEAMLSAITSAPRFMAPTFQAAFQRPSPDSLQVTLSSATKNKIDEQEANVMVALYENGLVTDCSNGENKGRVLANDYVVRKLENLCSAKEISAKKTMLGGVNFPLWEGFNSNKCGLVIFIENNAHQIICSQSLALPENL